MVAPAAYKDCPLFQREPVVLFLREPVILQLGADKVKQTTDLLGYTMNIAAKICAVWLILIP
jgi:hypothetical protein